jgi:hypothetical protein
MSNKLNPQELRLASQLSRAGIPLDGEMLKAAEVAGRGLVLYPGPNFLDNEIFDVDPRGTGFRVTVGMHNDSPRILRLGEPHLGIPWRESRFRWLEYPLGKVPREYTYDFPPPGPRGFDPSGVLNHRFGRRGRLLPDEWREGLLLAVGDEPMPDHYRNRQCIKIPLRIPDERGNLYTADIPFLVTRQGNRLRELKLLEQLSSPEAVARRREQLRAGRRDERTERR